MVIDRDKLWTAEFWRALQRLTGVRMRMSSAFHPETDGSSERSNKSINQAIRFFVDRQQAGWSKCLPRVRFGIMNTLNASTGYSGFQLKMGRSPRVVPALTPNGLSKKELTAREIIEQLRIDTMDAQDAMIRAKVDQAHQINKTRAPEPNFAVGDKVWLSTKNRRRQYMSKNKGRVAKFVFRYDGPYTILRANAELSSYTLDIPLSPETFNTFTTSDIKPWTANDDELFPSRKRDRPGPIMTAEGIEEFYIDSIIDERRRGKGYQYLVRWLGYGPDHDEWLPGREVEDCEALDKWKASRKGD